MRWLAALALFALATVSGCIDTGADGSYYPGADCSSSTNDLVGRTSDLLLPSDVPGADSPGVSVTARAGQSLSAVAVWTSNAGKAQLSFDGPSQHQVVTDGTWQSTATAVEAGEYTLQIEGSPVAYGATYTLVLTASGCTPP